MCHKHDLLKYKKNKQNSLLPAITQKVIHSARLVTAFRHNLPIAPRHTWFVWPILF